MDKLNVALSIEIFNKGTDTTLIAKVCLYLIALVVKAAVSLIGYNDIDTCIEEALLTQTVEQSCIIKSDILKNS